MATTAMLIARRSAKTHAFDPRSISGLFSWFSATNLSLSDGAPVAAWADQSVNGNDLAQSGAARPVFRTKVWNQLPGVLFSGAQNLDRVGTTGRPTGDLTVFVVASTFKNGPFPFMLSHGDAATNSGYMMYWSTGVNYGPSFWPVDGSGGEVVTDSTAAGLAQRANPCLYTGKRSGGTATIRTDKGFSSASASGSSGTIAYNGGDTLSLGHNGWGNRFNIGYLHEVLIYNRALTNTERDQVEAYLDAKWKLTRAQSAWFAWFNGNNFSTGYQIGHAWSPDGVAFKRYLSNPVLSFGVGWETGNVKDPYVIWDGSQFVMFYAGGPVAGIGRATSPDGTTWTKDAGNPVFTGGGNAWFPVIHYDAAAPAGHQYRMWYANGNGGSGTNVGFAHSADGITWTDVGGVLPVGAGGAWDAQLVYPCTVWFDGSTWTLYYGGRDVANSRDQGGQATFTDPSVGPYTRSGINPTLPDRPTATQSLTADAAAGSRVLHMADTSLFAVHMAVFSFSSNTASEQNRVLSVDSGTQLTLELPLISSRTLANSAGVAAFDHWHTLPAKGIFQLPDTTFRLYSGWYSPCLGTAGFSENREGAGVATGTTAAGPWTFDIVDGASGSAFMLNDGGEWDDVSAENINVIPHPVGV